MATQNWQGLVETVKQDLVAKGWAWHTNEDAFQILGRVAWALRNEGAMLILKSGAQNGAVIATGPHAGKKVSHDAMAFPDGWVDCLVGAGPSQNLNRPAWTWHAGPPPVAGTVLAPFDLDAGVVAAPPAPGAPAPVDQFGQITWQLAMIYNKLVEIAEHTK